MCRKTGLRFVPVEHEARCLCGTQVTRPTWPDQRKLSFIPVRRWHSGPSGQRVTQPRSHAQKQYVNPNPIPSASLFQSFEVSAGMFLKDCFFFICVLWYKCVFSGEDIRHLMNVLEVINFTVPSRTNAK